MPVIKTQVLAFFLFTPHPPSSPQKSDFRHSSLFRSLPLSLPFTPPLWNPTSFQLWKPGTGLHLKRRLQAFILSEDFPSSLTSSSARHLVLHLEFNWAVTWIKPGLPQRNTANPHKILQCQGGLAKWENCKTFALHSPRRKSFQSKYASLFFMPPPKYSKLWSLPKSQSF